MTSKIINILWSLPFIWFGISWIDIMTHQTAGGTDAAWNLFNIILH